MGASARQAARLLRLGPSTERRYRRVLTKAGLWSGTPTDLPTLEQVRDAVSNGLPVRVPLHERSSVGSWRPRIEALWKLGLSAQAIFDRLRIEPEEGAAAFTGSYSAVNRLVRRLAVARSPDAEDVAVPVVVRPGVAQVDFGYAGRLVDPRSGALRRAWFFVLVLSQSRLMFTRLVFDQRPETWIELHEQAFAALGGVPRTIIPDGARCAVTRAAFAIDGPSELHRSYRELAEQYGFEVDPTPPGQPWKKGVVEAAVKYVRNGPLKGRDGEAYDVVQLALTRWTAEIANRRVHRATGRRPCDVFGDEERATLGTLPSNAVERIWWKKARVHPDGHVALRDKLFSVPWPLIGQEVWIRATTRRVSIFHLDQSVAAHERSDRRRTTDETHLPAGRRELRHRGREVWEQRAGRIGFTTAALVRAIFEGSPVVSPLRGVQAIVTHLENHPRERAEAVSRLALLVGDHRYRWIKHALANALDKLGACPMSWSPPGRRRRTSANRVVQ